MNFEVEDFAFAPPSEKAHLLLTLSIAIPLAECGIEVPKAIALAQEKFPGSLPWGCDLSRLGSSDEMRKVHYEVGLLINNNEG